MSLTRSPQLSRRTFVRRAAASLAVVSTELQACALPRPGSVPPTAGGDSLQLPAYVPPQAPPPDLPGTAEGLPPGYFNYPNPLIKSVSAPPAQGGEFNPMVITASGGVPSDQNAALLEINKQLGLTLKMNIVAAPEYITRTNTLAAAGEIPELFYAFQSFPNMPQFLSSLCADLTPYLGGDAIKNYPNLASIPGFAWPFAVFGGRIYGVPEAFRVGSALLVNQTALDEVGATQFASADDFLRVAGQLTRAGSRWAFASNPLAFFTEVFRAPNGWRATNGKLARDWETDEYRAAVAFTRRLWDAGVIHPDSASMTPTQSVNSWYGGKAVFTYTTYRNYQLAWDRITTLQPAARPHAVQPFGHDGGSGVQFLTSSQTLTLLKKADPDRIRALLGVLNYTAAPFGTQEWELLHYGIRNVDFSLDDQGQPSMTERGTQEVTQTPPWLFTGPGNVLFDPRSAGFVQVAHDDQAAALALGLADPTAGKYSSTNADKGVTLNMRVTDGVKDIIFGRSEVSTLDQLVRDWRDGGGDQIRGEFEQQL